MPSHFHSNEQTTENLRLTCCLQQRGLSIASIAQASRTWHFCLLHLLTVPREVTGAVRSDHCNWRPSGEFPNTGKTRDSSCFTSLLHGHSCEVQLSHAPLVQGRSYTVEIEPLSFSIYHVCHDKALECFSLTLIYFRNADLVKTNLSYIFILDI